MTPGAKDRSRAPGGSGNTLAEFERDLADNPCYTGHHSGVGERPGRRTGDGRHRPRPPRRPAGQDGQGEDEATRVRLLPVGGEHAGRQFRQNVRIPGTAGLAGQAMVGRFLRRELEELDVEPGPGTAAWWLPACSIPGRVGHAGVGDGIRYEFGIFSRPSRMASRSSTPTTGLSTATYGVPWSHCPAGGRVLRAHRAGGG